MRRFWLLLLGIAVFTSGCSSGSSAEPITTAAPSPTTEVKATGSIFDSQFHPCEVLTDTQFQKAGLGDRLDDSADIGWGALGCSFGKEDRGDFSGSWLIATDQADRAHFENLGLETIDWKTESNPEMYVHQMPGNGRQCEAAVDYEWGRFTVNFYESGEGWEPAVLCKDATHILENLIQELGETE